MATVKDLGHSYARNAGADLSSALFLLAKVDTDGDIVLAAAAADYVLGTITEEAAENKPVTVQYGGESKAVVGSGGVTAGDPLTSDGSGQAVTAGSGENVFGVALEDAAQGAIVPFAFVRGVGQ